MQGGAHRAPGPVDAPHLRHGRDHGPSRRPRRRALDRGQRPGRQFAAQRLVRVVCPHCKGSTRLDRDIWDGDELLIPSGTQVVRPKGCERCMRTGYKGRTGLFEVVELDDQLRELVKAKAPSRLYRDLYATRQIASLRRAGLQKVHAGRDHHRRSGASCRWLKVQDFADENHGPQRTTLRPRLRRRRRGGLSCGALRAPSLLRSRAPLGHAFGERRAPARRRDDHAERERR